MESALHISKVDDGCVLKDTAVSSEIPLHPTFCEENTYETESDRNKPGFGVLPCVGLGRPDSDRSRQGRKPDGLSSGGHGAQHLYSEEREHAGGRRSEEHTSELQS